MKTTLQLWKDLEATLSPDDEGESAKYVRQKVQEAHLRAETDRMMNEERLRRSYLSEDEYSVSEDGQLINRHGIEWHEAPIPKRLLHVHDVWTRMYGGLDITDRCACGAIRSNMVAGGRWCLIDGWRKA